MKVTALAGGVGGARLLVGLQRAMPDPTALTAVVNTADDAVLYGVHVSPDVDIVTYWLAGMADTRRGWGLEADSFTVVETLRALSGEAWFSLGDRDLAVCLARTQRLAAGAPLSEVTAELARRLGVAARILPMSDDRVRTRVTTGDGRTLGFQEYFVRERTEPEVRSVLLEGIDRARAAPGVLEAIRTADRVIVCPSNPIVSVGPIVGLAGVRAELVRHPDVVAVSPIVGGVALKGPADRMLASLGHESSAPGVARLYADFCTAFVVDEADRSAVGAVSAWGPRGVVLDTIMSDEAASERLAKELLEL